MDLEAIQGLARLLGLRNRLDAEIGAILKRPMTHGHAGEWIASQIFDVELEHSASNAGIDGRFRSGPLAGRTVDVKWYLKHDSVLDITQSEATMPDHFLVFTGPVGTAGLSRSGLRPWCIERVFLFDAHRLRAEQLARGAKLGPASSILKRHWEEAEVYPRTNNALLRLTDAQADAVRLFSEVASKSDQ